MAILDKIGKLFGSDHKTTTETAGPDIASGLGNLLGNAGIGKELLGSLDSLKSLGGGDIQSILSALGQSSDTEVQAAKTDLQSSQHDAAGFVEKLKGYMGSLSQIVPLVLPVLKKVLGGAK